MLMTLSSKGRLQRTGYLTLTKFVEYLRENHIGMYVSYPTALRLVHEGKIKARKVGGQYRITREEIERWVEHGERE